MRIHGSLIDIRLTEGEEVGFFELTIDLEAQAAGFLDGFNSVQSDDAEKFIDAGGFDLQNDNDVDHGSRKRHELLRNGNVGPAYKCINSDRPMTLKTSTRCLITAMFVTAWTGMAQDAKPTPSQPEAKKEAGAAGKPAAKPVTVVKPEAKKEAETAEKPAAKPQPAAKPEAKKEKAPEAKAEAKEMAEKKKEAAKPAPPPKPIFADPNLEKAVRKQVFAKRDNNEPITADDVANLSSVDGKGIGIKDLSGLEKCTALASLTVPGNQIANLSPLKGLGRLQFLDLSQNQVVDISPLAECKALQYVELTGNKVVDVKPLAGIQALTSLYLANNQIADPSPLFKLPKVWTLYLEGNQVAKVDGIGGMRWLSMLSLKGNKLSDITPLEGLTELKFLFLDDNQIADFAPLHRMWKKDQAGERQWAPYCQIFTSGNPINEASKALLEEMKASGARLK